MLFSPVNFRWSSPLILLLRHRLMGKLSNIAFQPFHSVDGLVSHYWDIPIFGEASADYGAKSSEGIFLRGPSTKRESEIRMTLFKRNLHFLGFPSPIHGRSVCLLFRQRRRWVCNLPSCTRDFRLSLMNTTFQT